MGNSSIITVFVWDQEDHLVNEFTSLTEAVNFCEQMELGSTYEIEIRDGEHTILLSPDQVINIAENMESRPKRIPSFTQNEIMLAALDAGFMISTAYGQGENKLMPATDYGTLEAFVRKLKESDNGKS